MTAYSAQRNELVDTQIRSRGIVDDHVLEAMRFVPREQFVPQYLEEFAYEDSPLPIEAGQTISQPFIVAGMADAAELSPDDRVLEIGAGSGYAAAVFGRIAREVYAIERHEELAALARRRMRALGYDNAHIVVGDGTRGRPENAPYDAIIVSAGGPEVPESLRRQLAIGGRMIIPVGTEARDQELLRIHRTGEHEFDESSLGKVRFVPLVGAEGRRHDGQPDTIGAPGKEETQTVRARPPRPSQRTDEVVEIVRASAVRLRDEIDSVNLDAFVQRVGASQARVVLIGESTHGTSEFYRMRARLTRELIMQLGFKVLAIEGDWPDANVVDRLVRRREPIKLREHAFSRFPTWMWRNEEFGEFIAWLREYNDQFDSIDDKVSMHGLDLYSLHNSIGAVLDYLEEVDPEIAREAAVRYGCFSPWEADPATYGRTASSGRIRSCENDVVAVLRRLPERRIEDGRLNEDMFFDAERNATVVREADRYYREMHNGSRESWNLRDRHMFDTLQVVMQHRNAPRRDAKVVIWAHNSHVGDARATEMGARGEINLGHLVRQQFGEQAYLVGFATHCGTVAAASNWNDPVEIMTVRPSHPESFESLYHRTDLDAFFLPLRQPDDSELRNALSAPRLERAIGVIYRPETELLSHYFQAPLAFQFDEMIHFDHTNAVRRLATVRSHDTPDTYPFTL